MPRLLPSLTLLLITTLFLLNNACPSGKLNLTLKADDDYSSSRTRMLASVQKQKFRIAAFYFLDNAPSKAKKILTEQVVPGVIAYYQAALKAIPSPEPLSWSNSVVETCAGKNIDVPKALRDGVNADLVLIFVGEHLPGSFYAAVASVCDLEKGFKRPNFGRVQFNYDGFTDALWEDREYLTYLVLHEIGHILGFSNGLYEHYYNPKTGKSFDPVTEKIVNGQTIKVLDVEPLTTKMRKYFNCPSLAGAYLENEVEGGSAGHHFERRIFMNDVLTASMVTDTRVSEFYLALLEGSGWYSVNYNMAEPITWGKNKGCSLFTSKCVKDNKPLFSDMFCMPLEGYGCNFDNSGYGLCGTNFDVKSPDLPSSFNYYGGNRIILDMFADNCPYNFRQATCQDPTDNPSFFNKEYFGLGSSCFTGTLADLTKEEPYCLKRTCIETSSNKYKIIVEIGDTNVVCTKKGSVSVPGYSGTLNCPDPTSYCKITEIKYCPRGCMGRGECVNKKCRCYKGYSGSDCGIRETSTLEEGTLEYLEKFPGFTTISSSSEESKSKVKIPLRIMSVIIGVGIIGLTVVVGLTVNKIRDLRLKMEARKRSKVEYKISHPAPDHVYNFPNPDGMSPNATSLQNIQMGVIEEAQSPTNAAGIRQEALRDYFAPPADQANVDKLAVLRGYR